MISRVAQWLEEYRLMWNYSNAGVQWDIGITQEGQLGDSGITWWPYRDFWIIGH